MDNQINETRYFDNALDSLGNTDLTDLGLERSDLVRDFTQTRYPLVDNIHDKIDFSSWDNVVVSDIRSITTLYLRTAKIIAKSELTAFANDSELNDRLKFIFGDSYNTELADLILQRFAREDFRQLPNIETVDAEAIAGANGAFADTTNSIYLSNQFIEANFTNPQVIADVLLEEVGHYLDSQIKREDTPGDEGEIFSLIVRDKAIEKSKLQELKAEDDRDHLILDGQEILIEKSNSDNISSEQLTQFSQFTPIVSITAKDDNAEEINQGEHPNSGKFTIARTGDKTNELEKWEAGNPHSIAWKDNLGENVKIDLYQHDKFYQTLLKSTPSDGIETITLPAALPSSDDYSIKVGSVKHHQINDLSDGNFALDPEVYVLVTKDDLSSDLIWQNNIQGDLKVDLYQDKKFVTTLLTPDPFRDNQIISLKDLEPILSELSKDGDYSLKVSFVNSDGSTNLVGKADALL